MCAGAHDDMCILWGEEPEFCGSLEGPRKCPHANLEHLAPGNDYSGLKAQPCGRYKKFHIWENKKGNQAPGCLCSSMWVTSIDRFLGMLEVPSSWVLNQKGTEFSSVTNDMCL